MEINYKEEYPVAIYLKDLSPGQKFKFAYDAIWIKTNYIGNDSAIVCNIDTGSACHLSLGLKVLPVDDPREPDKTVKLSDLAAGETFVFGEYNPSNEHVYVRSSYLLLTRQVMTLRLSDGTRQDFDGETVVTKVNCKVEVSKSEN